MAIGVRFVGPGASPDVLTWMMTEVEPIIKNLAATDAKTFQLPGATGTDVSTTTAG